MLNTFNATKDFRTVSHSIQEARKKQNGPIAASMYNDRSNRFHWANATEYITIPPSFKDTKCYVAANQDETWHKAVLINIPCKTVKAFNAALLHVHGIYSYNDLIITGGSIRHDNLTMFIHPVHIVLDVIPPLHGDSHVNVHVSFRCSDCDTDVFTLRTGFAIDALKGIISLTDYDRQRERYAEMEKIINDHIDKQLQPPVMGIIGETILGKKLSAPRPKMSFKLADGRDAIDAINDSITEALKSIDNVTIHATPAPGRPY